MTDEGVSLGGQTMLNNKRESESGLSPTAVVRVWTGGLRKGQDGGTREVLKCGLAAPGRWVGDRAACWANTLAGCDRCAGHRCMSRQQLHGWLSSVVLRGQTLNAQRRFPAFPLCFAWRNPNSVGSAKEFGTKKVLFTSIMLSNPAVVHRFIFDKMESIFHQHRSQ